MRNKIIGFVISLAVLGLFAFIFNLYFEIAEHEVYTRPSIEAMSNSFLALDRWLLSNDFTIRVENKGDYHVIEDSFEDIIFIQSDNFSWDKESIDLLLHRVEYGATFILSLGFSRHWPEQSVLGEFLGSLGLESFYPEGGYSFTYDSNAPSFARNITFVETETENAYLVLRDAEDYIRLVAFQKGQGKIIIMGRPRFLENYSISSPANARLGWYLFAGGDTQSDSRSVFFIRGDTDTEGLISGFFQRGNFLIIIIAMFLLIAVGFWAALPVFGIVKENTEGKGKTLSERFLAEGRFYKRYNSLDVYTTLYTREIKRRLNKKESPDDKEIKEFIRGENGKSKSMPKDIKHFSKSIVILKTILERL